MGKLENEAKINKRNATIKKAVLGAVALAGVLSVAAIAPAVLPAIEQLQGKKRKSLYQRLAVDTARRRLVDKGLIEYDGRGFLKLTRLGKEELAKLEASEYKIKIPKRWDEKWRVIIFDIKEERRSLRSRIRRTVLALGFRRLQDSVWIFPYDCEDLMTLLKADFKIGKDLLYLIVEKIENDKPIKDLFGLK